MQASILRDRFTHSISKRLREVPTPLATYAIQMVAIAEVLETDHGWDLEQANAWLERMGLWDEQL